LFVHYIWVFREPKKLSNLSSCVLFVFHN
jgi:hypothetical protein